MIGLGFAVVAIFVAGIVEHFRLKKYWDYQPSTGQETLKIIGAVAKNKTIDRCCYAMVPQQIGMF
jgi:hypothetical protein